MWFAVRTQFIGWSLGEQASFKRDGLRVAIDKNYLQMIWGS